MISVAGRDTWVRRAVFGLRSMALAGVCAAALTACATPPAQDHAATSATAQVSDPLEPVNRGIHAFNEGVDKVLLRPVATGYRNVVPMPVRERVRNFLQNLKGPIIFANDILQGEFTRGMTTFYRFAANTTFGLGGIHDVAAEMGLPRHEEDFGQTLAVAGVDSGPYIVLPILGPSNLRDTVGLAVDWFFDPFRMYEATQNPEWGGWVTPTRIAVTAIDTREALLDPIDEIEKSSLDTYASFRTLYTQQRSSMIANQDGAGMSAPQVEGSAFDFPDAEDAPEDGQSQ